VRELATAGRINSFIEEVGRAASSPATMYLAGGATAVLLGWRETTIDVDIKLVPESDELLRAIPRLKEELKINVELASPDHFIPVKDGWEARSPHIRDVGRLTVRHFELCAQAVGKLERAHSQDLADVDALVDRGLVTKQQIVKYFEEVKPLLFRFPAIDPAAFEDRVRTFAAQ
jgi:hypothetical protein